MKDELFEVDRLGETDEQEPEIVVHFPDGRKVRFWQIGLSDEEYVRRAKILRARDDEGKKIFERKWFCETCGAGGIVAYRDGAGLYEVIRNLGRAHYETSPECKTGLEKVRCPQK